MKNISGIAAASLLICALAGPARAELSSAADTGAVPAADAGGENAVFSLLDKYAENNQPSPSDASLISALTKTGSPMNAYYSVIGSNDQQVVASLSATPPYSAMAGPNHAPSAASAHIMAGTELAALVQGGIPVGSNALVSGESVAPLSGVSSSPIYAPLGNTLSTPSEVPSVPIPLPFLLFGSGLAALLGLKKRAMGDVAA